ncbi:hypothetical protein pEaSNUABM50_00028 [Erwinia phage pEa_SNUABM_50]|uniref:Uncharacterized protein n=2 Tax=Eneladusvirus BF TaxID=2560751 RepID=A0A7L8ZPB7_9CAUD|nr:hypothetical protein pEaSNUABM12_00030 [Erwinia phage pEa_SNUABM_12]QOI72052.1 hypothetical protein pEaSNUABM50_00028 [Erwinia phage pEa_SNUABM_50]QXO11176.1 hypothetical protein pEaSNUABM19_00030 [Erwinia phage pEa_SNUABM_19]QXO11724.1 hypothetical protein pEaSNUABM44_00028 [Erwinia phage pEa_SNUABM_44]
MFSPFVIVSVLKREDNNMFTALESLVREEVSEEEVKAGLKLRDLCIQNDLDIPEVLMTLHYFNGIEPKLIIDKVSALNTPLLENAMHVLH